MKNIQEKSKWREIVERAPEGPGVYVFRDSTGSVIYIGKASDLKERVKAYAHGEDGRFLSLRIHQETEDAEFIPTSDGAEALFLEDRLIKELNPRYNVRLKDDKTYTCIVLEKKSPWPRIRQLRRPDPRGNVIFGPFPSASGTRRMIEFLQYVFPLRTCSDNTLRHRKRPCIEYEMGRCLGPCAGMVSKEEYMGVVREAEKALKRGLKDIEKLLEQRMREKAEMEEFEQAAAIRDVLLSLRNISAGLGFQRTEGKDFDVIAFVFQGTEIAAAVVSYRSGVMTNVYRYTDTGHACSEEEVVSDFIRSYYSAGRFLPDKIYLNRNLKEKNDLENFLTHLKGRRVRIVSARTEPMSEVMKAALKNAEMALTVRAQETEWQGDEVAKVLHLPRAPAWVEAFDISRYGASLVVGSSVAMIHGILRRELYRRYRVQKKELDDYAAMREILSRRLRRGIAEDSLPDLILIDGGRGHLNVALQCLEAAGLGSRVSAVALSKPVEKFGPETIHLADGKVLLEGRALCILALLRHLRDEAHRFALSYLRKLDMKVKTHSELLSIPGVGPETARSIILQTGSVKKLRDMSLKELKSLHGIGDKTAEKIYSYFHRGK